MAGRYAGILSAAARAVRAVRAHPIARDPETRRRVSAAVEQSAVAGIRPMNPNHTWSYRIDVPPYDKLVDVLEAFFASYPGGDYACERRERYKLQFRRGRWRRSLLGLGPLVPDSLARGRFNLWPIVVRVLVRPSPEVFTTAIHYDLYLPKGMGPLPAAVRSSVDQHARRELEQLAAYLAECTGRHPPPAVTTL